MKSTKIGGYRINIVSWFNESNHRYKRCDEFFLYHTQKHISLVNETLISPENWQKADLLTRKVDNKDIAFVALALQLDAFLWTLDKPLTNHLRQNDFDKVVNTGELVEVLSNQN